MVAAAEPSAPVVRIRGLTKSFGGTQVLKGVDLDVGRGEVIAVIGSSGSGKTTLLRCINFLEEYDGGSIKVDDEEVGFREAGGRRKRRPERGLSRPRAGTPLGFPMFNPFPPPPARQKL